MVPDVATFAIAHTVLFVPARQPLMRIVEIFSQPSGAPSVRNCPFGMRMCVHTASSSGAKEALYQPFPLLR